MKKTTVYTLLCTTIIMPTLSLATDESLSTPIKSKTERLKEEAVKGLPTTPQITQEVKSKIKFNILSEKQAQYFLDKGVERKKDEREALKAQKFFEIEQDESKERLSREVESSKKTVEEQARLHEMLIEGAKKATILKREENEALSRKLSDLAATIEENAKEIEVLNDKLSLTEELSREAIDDLTLDIQERTKQLSEARAAQKVAQMKASTLKLQLSIARESEERLEKGLREIASQEAQTFSSPIVNSSSPQVTQPIEPINTAIQSNASDVKVGKTEESDEEIPNGDL
jgi:chromosome segregation ATPase